MTASRRSMSWTSSATSDARCSSDSSGRLALLWALKRSHANRPELTEEQRASLVAELVDDIERLEAVTGQSFDDWRGHRVGGTYSVRRA